MIHFDLVAAHAAYEVMMVGPGQLIPQMTAARLGKARETVLREKPKRSIHRRLGQPWEILFCRLVHLARGEVFAGMTENMQDRHPLQGDAEAARAKLRLII